MNEYCIFDIETDGLLEEVSVIHCLSYRKFVLGVLTEEGSLTDYNDIINFIQEQKVLIGHNIIRYDIPVLEKILRIKIKARLIDTLGLSWYLYPTRLKHGLEEWGEDFGVPKPKIADWKNLNVAEYIHRCSEDVKINHLLWDKQKEYLERIYLDAGIYRILGYISFKLDCAREQEEIGWRLDVKLCEDTLEDLLKQRDKKLEVLSRFMPKVTLYKKATKPKNMFKKDGNLSEAGKRWMNNIRDLNLPLDYSEDIKVPIGTEEGNPSSPTQVKDWLFSLGWKPCTFNYVKNKDTGEQRSIPQVYGEQGVTKSVKDLFEKEPNLVHFEGLSIINHRIGILQGFLKNRDKNDFLKAEIKGFTNTMRFQHTVIVNLPTIHKPYGKQIRGALIAPDDDHVLCGSDMSSLEDNTKQHYMYFYDPEYVKEMRIPGFSPHLDIGVQGGMITQEESDFYIWYEGVKSGNQEIIDIYQPKVPEKYLSMSSEEQEKEIKRISGIRKDAKQVNFSAVYGVGPPKMSLTTGWSIEKSTQMLKVYWERNHSVKKVANKTTHKTVDNQMWLWNPVSCFWYSLRYEKDKFSTLNQGTGVYCFDTWVRNVRNDGNKICGQFHDEIITPTKKGKEEEKRKSLLKAIELTNQQLKLNVDLGISIDFGNRYSDIH